MEFIDFRDAPCLLPPQSDHFMRPDGYHAEVNTGSDFGYKTLQDAANIPEEIPASIPEDSLFLDIGGGHKPFWDLMTMRRRHIDRLHIDFESNALAAQWNALVTIGVDLNRLTDEFVSAPDIKSALRVALPIAGKCRKQIEQLLTLFERPIGGVTFSHVLCYVQQERVRGLIKQTLSSLTPGGSAWIMDMPPAFFGVMKKKGFTEGFDDAAAIVAEDNRFSIAEHSLLVPRILESEVPVFKAAAERRRQGLERFADLGFCQSAVMHDPRRLARLPFTEGMDKQVLDDGEYIGVPWFGERLMHIRREY